MLALSEGDRIYRVKRTSEEHSIEGNIVYTRWKPWADVEVQTWLIAGTPWHVRVHCIQSGRYLGNAADGGFALGIDDFKGGLSRVIREQEDAIAVSSWGSSGIRLLHGKGRPELTYPNANTNLLHSRTVIPTITASLDPGRSWLVTGIYGQPGDSKDEDYWINAPYVISRSQKLVVREANGKELFTTAASGFE